jgi:hypothetical protein
MRIVVEGMQCYGFSDESRSVGIAHGTQRNAGMRHLSWALVTTTLNLQDIQPLLRPTLRYTELTGS